MQKATTVEGYIQEQTPEWQNILNQVRKIMHEVAPEGKEDMKYGMPTLVGKKNVVHYAACKAHLGFYPTPSGIAAFEEELKDFVTSKGAIQFPLTKEIPYDLIRKITMYRWELVQGKK